MHHRDKQDAKFQGQGKVAATRFGPLEGQWIYLSHLEVQMQRSGPIVRVSMAKVDISRVHS